MKLFAFYWVAFLVFASGVVGNATADTHAIVKSAKLDLPHVSADDLRYVLKARITHQDGNGVTIEPGFMLKSRGSIPEKIKFSEECVTKYDADKWYLIYLPSRTWLHGAYPLESCEGYITDISNLSDSEFEDLKNLYRNPADKREGIIVNKDVIRK